MAMCFKCQGEMGQTETVCPHCGYDFPAPVEQYSLEGWWFVLVLFGLGSVTYGREIGELHSSAVLGAIIGGAIGFGVIAALTMLLRSTRTPLGCLGGLAIVVMLWGAITLGYMLYGDEGAYIGNVVATVFTVGAWSLVARIARNRRLNH